MTEQENRCITEHIKLSKEVGKENFMKMSTKGRYGLRALLDLAVCENEKPVTLATIAQRQHLSLNYLEQVFGVLRRAELVKSIKGANGGYHLARNAEDITVKEVLEALEGKFSIRCV